MSKRSAVAPHKPLYRYSGTGVFIKLEYRSDGGGGAYRDRTDDLMLAKQPLSQLS